MTQNSEIRTNALDLRALAQGRKEAEVARKRAIEANEAGSDMLRMVAQGTWDGIYGPPAPKAAMRDNSDIMRELARFTDSDRNATIRSLAAFMDNAA